MRSRTDIVRSASYASSLATWFAVLLIGISSLEVSSAQVLSSVATAFVKTDIDSTTVLAGAASTLLTFTVDPGQDGGDLFDVNYSNVQIAISLLLPNSVEVTSSTASAFGIEWVTYAATGSEVAGPTPFVMPGNHVLIVLPAGSTAGTYQIKANAASTNADDYLTGIYYSSSTVVAGVVSSAPIYHPGDTVVFSGVVLDNGMPVASAFTSIDVGLTTDISSQGSIGSYSLVSQSPVDDENAIFTYSASFSNSGSAVQVAGATLQNLPSTPIVIDGTLAFQNVPANGSANSVKTFSVQLPTVNNFDPTTLSWAIKSLLPSTQVSLVDSGPFDAAPGDGIYTGTYVPTMPGDYFATFSATGTSLAGLLFSRKTTTTFRVDPSTGGFTSFQDQAFDDDGNGLFDRLVITANLNIQIAGTYLFSVQLQASNGQTLLGTAQASLSAGSSQVSVTFSAADILGTLATSGPYTLSGATLIYLTPDADVIADTRASAGNTAPYALSSFDPGPLYLTGQNSATGIDTTGSGMFDILRVQLGIHNPAGSCIFSGTLADSSGSPISYISGNSPTLQPGKNSITLDFNGNLIAQAGKDGPYLIQSVGLTCAAFDTVSTQPIQITGFTASQFHLVPQSLGLTLSPSTVTVLEC